MWPIGMLIYMTTKFRIAVINYKFNHLNNIDMNIYLESHFQL